MVRLLPKFKVAAQMTALALLMLTACQTAQNQQGSTLSVTVEGSGSGTVTSVPEGIDVSTGGTAMFDFGAGAEVTLTASAALGSIFTGWTWTGACNVLEDFCVVTMHSSLAITASFAIDLDFVSVSAGIAHTCGVTSDGEAFCWGHDLHGQLGTGIDGGFANVPTPVAGGDLEFASLSAGGNHTCGVSVAGDAYCWGYGELGQLGNGRQRRRAGCCAGRPRVPFCLGGP